MILLLISLLLASPLCAAERSVRREAPWTPAAHRDEQAYPRPCVIGYGDVAEMLYPEMTEQEKWFVAKELAFLNDGVWDKLEMTNPLGIVPWGMTLTVPVYRPYTGGKGGCYDLRNWFVAVHKGKKYGVDPALLVAIRSHENPEDWCGCDSRYRWKSRDDYAYGVEHLKGTDLWAQAGGAAKIVKRIATGQGWSPLYPTRARLLRLARVYVGQGEVSARNWSKQVWTMHLRARP